MAVLPFSRVVDVTVSRQDRFPTRQGFSTILLLTALDGGGAIGVGNETKLYSSIQELVADFAGGTSVHNAATAILNQNPSVRQFKVGHVPTAAGVNIVAEMATLLDFDNDWYWLVPADLDMSPVFAAMQSLSSIVTANNKQLLFDSSDALHESVADATNISAQLKLLSYDRVSSFYHPTAGSYLAAATAGYTARRNFDQRDQAYTAKFKTLAGIAHINKPSAVVQAITGFTPGLGLSTAAGHLANTYIDIGGQSFLVEGNTLGGTFIDVIHATDWIRARVQEEMLAALLNNDVVPYTDIGMQILVAAVESVCQRGVIAGILSPREDVDGNMQPAYEISHDRVGAVPASQRANRIAPDIQACIRYSGAIHWASANIIMKF